MRVVPLASGSQEARFTQPLREKFALLCIVGIFLVSRNVILVAALQGGSSGCTLPFSDVKINVPSQYGLLILKRNSQFNVNKL